MSRIINRLTGRVYGWFDSKDARPVSKPLPAKFRNGRSQLAVMNLEDRVVPAGVISGIAFNDIDGNGTQGFNDPATFRGELGLSNVTMFLDTNNNGVLDTGGLINYPSIDTPVTIVDLATVTSTITVPDNYDIFDINVNLNITHTWDADVEVSLMGPDGTIIDLTSGNGGSGDNYIGTTFDDSAATSITTGTAPFTGSFRPEQMLSIFNGKPVNGNWTLSVFDNTASDVGTLDNWSLDITAAGEKFTTTDTTGAYTFNVADGTFTVAQKSSTLPTGFTPSTPASGSQSVTISGDAKVANFASRRASGAIYGTVFADGNSNNTPDVGEGQAGVSVYNDLNNNSKLDVSSTIAPGVANLPLPIVDNTIQSSSTDPVVAAGFISSVTVTIGDLTHTFDGDLDIFLISPSGTRVELSTDNGGAGDNFINTVFADSAATAITAGVAPFTGSFRPETPLAALIGENPNGVWILEIGDDAGGDIGSLNSWSITIETSTEAVTRTDANGNYFFAGLPAGNQIIRQVPPTGFTQVAPAANGPQLVTTTATSGVAGIDFANAQSPVAVATGAYPPVTVDDPSTNPYIFSVRYTNVSDIDQSTIGDDDVVVVPSAGVVTFIPGSITGGGGDVTAMYQLVPTGGWTVSDNGTYTIQAVAGKVSSINGFSTAQTDVATFNVAFPQTIVVTTDLDVVDANDGVISLREAVTAANKISPSPDTITFDTTVFATDKTIDLSLLGSLSITDGVIIGNATPTAGVISISGGSVVRVFSTATAPTDSPITFRNLSLINGNATGSGGAIQIGDEAVVLQNVTLTGNTSSSGGGAIYAAAKASLSITGSTISTNTAGGRGGAIHWVGGTTNNFSISASTIANNVSNGNNGGGGGIFASAAKLSIDQSTISGNLHSAAAYGGGGIYAVGGAGTSLIISNSTISGNTTNGIFATGGGGGGIYTFTTPETYRISNSTITGNSAPFGGGISLASTKGTLELTNSTVYNNIAGNANGGGGIFSKAAINTIINIDSTVVAVNTAGGIAEDFFFPTPANVTTNASYSAWSSPYTPNGISDSNLENADLTSMQFGLLENKGGLTNVVTLGSASILRNVANPVQVQAFDQRGTGFPRVNGPRADIGAFETEQIPGQISAIAAGLVTIVTDVNLVTNPYTFTVTYAVEAPNVINVSTIDNFDIRVKSNPANPFVYNELATYVVGSATPNSNASSITATYRLVANPTTWTSAQNGSYSVSVEAGAITSDFPSVIDASTIGSLQVAIPDFVVRNVNDSGYGSLRDALEFANANPDPNIITFVTTDGFFTGDPAKSTINLMSGLNVDGPVTINGILGANKAVVSGGGLYRVFNTLGAPTGTQIDFNDLTITGGNAPAGQIGGGILVVDEIVTLNRSIVTGNSVSNGGGFYGAGGGIALNNAYGSVTLNNSVVSNNNSQDVGGGIFLGASALFTINGSTISGNIATASGGGIFANGGTPTLRVADSTVSGNSGGNGGGIYFFNGGSMLLERSTVSGNNSSGAGGGIYFYGTVSPGFDGAGFRIRNSTISGNIATANGGGLALLGGGYAGNLMGIVNSTITGNLAASGGGLANTTVNFFNITSSIITNNLGAEADVDFADGLAAVSNSAVGVLPTGLGLFDYSSPTNLSQPNSTPAALGLNPTLANNGGPTLTHSITTTGTAFNTGANPDGLVLDQTGGPRSSMGGVDIGAVEASTAVGIPAVTGFVINDGLNPQRSRITSITVTFAGTVSPSQFTGMGAIQLIRPEVGPGADVIIETGATGTNGLISVTQPGATNTLVLTFSIADASSPIVAGIVEYGSLGDGRYRLEIAGAGGSGYTSNPTNPSEQIRRLFGDINGDGTVNGSVDFAGFGTVFGTNVPLGNPFDFNQDGTIDGTTDFAQFGARFGVTV